MKFISTADVTNIIYEINLNFIMIIFFTIEMTINQNQRIFIFPTNNNIAE